MKNFKTNKEEMSYKEAIQMAKEIREQRSKVYGDSWKDRKEYQLLGLVMEKSQRLESQFLNESDGSYENKKDCLVDLINWAAFYLAKLK